MLLAIGYSDTCSFSVVPSCPMDKRCMSAPDQPCRSTRRLGTAVKSHLPPLQLRGATFAFALVRPLELSEMQVLRCQRDVVRSEEHTSELQSLMRISYAVFCLKKKKT